MPDTRQTNVKGKPPLPSMPSEPDRVAVGDNQFDLKTPGHLSGYVVERVDGLSTNHTDSYLEKVSGKRLAEAFAARGVDVSALPTTPAKGWPQFNKITLPTIDDDLARTLLAYSGAKKMADYSKDLFKYSYADRLYGSFRQIGPQTGRMSSHKPNLQNFPKSDLRTRYCIRAREGHRPGLTP